MGERPDPAGAAAALGNLTTTVTWVSSDTSIATVENFSGKDGLATGIAAGSATISASRGAGPSGSTLLTVTP